MIAYDYRQSPTYAVNVQNAMRYAKQGARDLRAEENLGAASAECVRSHSRMTGVIAGMVFRNLDELYDPHAMAAARALWQACQAEEAA